MSQGNALPSGYNPLNMLREFLKMEAAAGMILVFFAVVAMIIANIPFTYEYYHAVLHDTKLVVGIKDVFEIDKDLIHWINDGLMALFFFLVGLEIKREVKEGLLSTRDQVVLPVVAAIGGMAMPGLVYFFFNQADPATLKGWAIPAATDIAFALGVLTLLGKRVPIGLKVFLLAIAIIDDLGAILIIALFYSGNLSIGHLMAAAVFLVILVYLNQRGVNKATPYIMVGIAMWACVLKSGIHATLAGVLTAFTIPLIPPKGERRSMLRQLEHDMHGFISYFVLPVFAFANAGVSLKGASVNILFDPVTLGVIMGLFVGKQVGIFSATYLVIKSGLAKMPAGCNWLSIWGLSCLAGIGFTMSLFIGTLAFIDYPLYLTEAKMGILIGSLMSALFGLFLMNLALPKVAEDVAVPTPATKSVPAAVATQAKTTVAKKPAAKKAAPKKAPSKKPAAKKSTKAKAKK